jgi:predicted secreted acid phosphatase
MVVSWKQTAAEYEALYHQGRSNARGMGVEQAVARGGFGYLRRPPAVITDPDDTLFDTRGYC